MAIAFVQSKTGTGAGTGSATAASATYTAGNFIAVSVAKNSTTSTITMSNTGTALTWNQAKRQTGNGQSVDIWYAMNIVGQTCTLKATSSVSTDDVAIVAQEFSGVAASAAIDQTAGATGSSSSPSSGATAATTVANELVFGALASNDSSNDVTLGAGYSNLGTAFNAAVLVLASAESKVVSATGAQTATFGMGGFSSSWDCAVATFKAASGATTVAHGLPLLGVGL